MTVRQLRSNETRAPLLLPELSSNASTADLSDGQNSAQGRCTCRSQAREVSESAPLSVTRSSQAAFWRRLLRSIARPSDLYHRSTSYARRRRPRACARSSQKYSALL